MTHLQDLPGIYTEPRQATAIDAIANDYYDKLLELDPTAATIAGQPGHETEYFDYSPAGYRALLDLTRDTLTKVRAAEVVDDVDRVTVDAMNERLGLDIELAEAGLGDWEINNIACPIQDIRAVLDLMPRETTEQWGHLAGRMANIPGAIEGWILTLKQAKDQGKVSARRQVSEAIEQIEDFVRDGGFFPTFTQEIIDAAPELEEQARLGETRAIAGYRTLQAFLRDELLSVAPEADAVGPERYSLYSRKFLGTTVDLEETYHWGVAELERIIAEQQETAEKIKPGASIDEAKAILDADPERALHGVDALQAWMQRLSDTAMSEMAEKYFVVGGPMKKLECCIAPTHDGGIYYTGPSPDFTRPGRMWWSVPEGDTEFGTWRETSTVYHEGVPGHHLQIAVATALESRLNKWRAHGCWTSGHGEGWALYAERLMQELGFLDDPGDTMGMLNEQRMRAARVVFDIGLHCGYEIPEQWVERLGLTPGIWTPEAAFEFLKANLTGSAEFLRHEYLRYLGWPGQAPSYKIGQRVWEQLREQARKAGTAGEHDRDFHTRALMLGSMGLDTLQRALSTSPKSA